MKILKSTTDGTPCMKQEQYRYLIYPLTFPAGTQTAFVIQPQGAQSAFAGAYRIAVHRVDAGSSAEAFTAWNAVEYEVSPQADGFLHFTYGCDDECEHFVRVYRADDTEKNNGLVQLSVYSLKEDLAGLLPLRGDLHLHTFRSDGKEDPALVCASYRALGCDFLSITDHKRYYPSLEAMRAYAGADHALSILPGEEVQLPGTDVHIINAGGLFSVNGLLPELPNYEETSGALSGRRAGDSVEAPPVLSPEAYERAIAREEAAATDCPQNVNRRWYAVCKWAFDRIREADGCGIFAHPFWIRDVWHLPEPFTRYMLEKHPFDAFEVLGGEIYYQQNGFQTALYYDEYRFGRVHPIVGSTDSHSSTPHNRKRAICSSIVFARANDRASVVQAIRSGYSVAVDTISAEYRLVGEYRLQKYAAFLMENYFPLHDRLASVDGEVMREYCMGEANAEELHIQRQKMQALWTRCFAALRMDS